MSTPAAKPLIPTLPDAFNKRIQHAITALDGGDQLHLTSKLLGFPKGAVLPIYGYCALFDDNGQPYSVRAYVRGTGAAGQPMVTYSQREAVRFRFDTQQERWFGNELLMYLVEIDLTDFADCLKLEHQPAHVAELLAPTMRVAAPTSHPQRLAA